jgi:transposase
MGKKTRRVFDKEFKIEAVRLTTVGDRTVREIAESLDIHVSLLTKWIRASREEGSDAFRGQGKRTALEEEIWRLRLQNKQLEQELEFLKKVSRYFAKDPK